MSTIQQLRELRANLPVGRKDPWTACCKSKRVLFTRALKKESISDLTLGEQGVVREFLEHCAKVRKENERLEESITKTAQL